MAQLLVERGSVMSARQLRELLQRVDRRFHRHKLRPLIAQREKRAIGGGELLRALAQRIGGDAAHLLHHQRWGVVGRKAVEIRVGLVGDCDAVEVVQRLHVEADPRGLTDAVQRVREIGVALGVGDQPRGGEQRGKAVVAVSYMGIAATDVKAWHQFAERAEKDHRADDARASRLSRLGIERR